jgi:hypothetical protein
MGNHRYYLTPVGLILPDELPRGWGLLERDGRRTVERVKAEWFADKNQREEIALLVRCATPPELIKRTTPIPPDPLTERA